MLEDALGRGMMGKRQRILAQAMAAGITDLRGETARVINIRKRDLTEQILQSYVAGLKRMFPDLRDEDVVQARVFRSAFVEPLYTLGYQRRQPPVALVPGRVFLSTAAQVYPEVTSWNGSAGLARRIVDQKMAER